MNKIFETKLLLVFMVILVCSLITGCPQNQETNKDASPTPKKEKTVLRVGFIPSENMAEIQKNAQPLVDMLSKKLGGMEVQPFIATDYTGIVEAFRANKLDVGFLSPASYVMAKNEADVKVILKAQRGDKPYYYSVIFVRKDSNIKDIDGLKGKTFAFGDTLSTAGHIFPKKVFNAAKIDPANDFENVLFAGGHDATVLAVLNKKVVGGATYANDTKGEDTAWTQMLKPEESNQLIGIKYSEPIPADNICISSGLEPKLAEKVKKVFVAISQDPEGQKLIKKLYKIDQFVPASDEEYQGVRDAFSIAGIELRNALKNK